MRSDSNRQRANIQSDVASGCCASAVGRASGALRPGPVVRARAYAAAGAAAVEFARDVREHIASDDGARIALALVIRGGDAGQLELRGGA